MLPASDLMTADQLLSYEARGMRTELARGELLVRELAGYRHGSIAARVLSRSDAFLEADQASRQSRHPLGEVLAAETGFTLQIDPDRRVVRVYRADGSESILDDRQAIDGESPLPGVTLPLAVLFHE